MEVLNRTSEGLEKCYNVLIQPKELEDALDSKLKETAKKVRLDGFRPGKVPVSIVKRMYGDAVAAESKEEAINDTARNIIREENLVLATRCTTSFVKEDENGLEFSMKFEVMPTFELKPYEGLEIVKHVTDATEEEIKKVINDLRERNADWIDDPELTEVSENCQVTLDMVVHMDTNPEKNTMKDIVIVINDRNKSQDLEQKLIGAKVGETREFSISIPDEIKQGAETTMFYTATIKGLKKQKLIESDEELAKVAKFENVDKMNEWAMNIVKNEYDNISAGLMHRDVLEKLSTMYDFDVPNSLVDIEEKEVVQQIEKEAERLGKEFTPHIKDECRKLAAQRVRLGMIIAEIAKKENISITNQEMSVAIRQLAMMYPGIQKEIQHNEYLLRSIAAPILEKKVVNHLIDQAKTTEAKCTRDELIALDEEEFDFFKETDGKAKTEATETESKPKKAASKKKETASEDAAETPKKKASTKKKSAE